MLFRCSFYLWRDGSSQGFILGANPKVNCWPFHLFRNWLTGGDDTEDDIKQHSFSDRSERDVDICQSGMVCQKIGLLPNYHHRDNSKVSLVSLALHIFLHIWLHRRKMDWSESVRRTYRKKEGKLGKRSD